MKRIAIAAAVLAASFFAYFFLTSISEEDIYAYHDLERPLGAEPLRAGDVVALSPDGQRMEQVCDLDLHEGLVAHIPLEDVYFNSLGDTLPDFAKLIDWGRGLLLGPPTGGSALPERDQIVFRGSKSSITQPARALADMPESCECAMARRLNARQRVCTVRASLVEARLFSGVGGTAVQRPVERTVAISLKSHSNIVSEQRFTQCELEMSEAASATMMLECDGPNLPFDTQFRQRLNLIERAPFDQALLQN